MAQTDDRRYTMRLRPLGKIGSDTLIPLDIGGGDEVGVWDTVERRFVKHNPVTNEWEAE